ncbi:TonB-dependent receptor plug domain-containing protein [Undibacterium rugosum]|uniref:TonB-dependent receptor plug domain-containing protein n=1 Tax=Undibacterium rugosum TaxID=2762291 RepID=UPI001B82BA13|nr:TonB-dependent receptor [Undibacterium rugosum]MBR7778876.1 TonB-dependent receptor [Undibacterium rugosum]
MLFSVSSGYAQTTQEEAPVKEAPTAPAKAKADLGKSDKQAKPATSKEVVQQVTVSGGRTEVEERRQSTAGKIIYGREELDRNGDSSLGEVLKRLPGVTVGGRPGRGGDIRMRGMGNGYTQILINGERAPRGFSMDSLSPDQVERIEIVRGAVAEFSTQAIAGTINIVLREEYKQKTTDLKISLGSEQGRLAPNVSLTVPGEAGALSYVMSGSVFKNKQHDQSLTDSLEKNTAGETVLKQHQQDQTDRETTGLHLTPRFNYKFENGDTLNFQPFLMTSKSNSQTWNQVNELFRSPTYFGPQSYATANSSNEAETTFLRGFGNWQHKFENNGKLVVRFGGGLGKMNSSSMRYQFNQAGQQIDVISDVNNTRDRTANTGGKLTMPIGDAHTIATGWELEAGKRSQTRTSLDNGLPQYAESGDNLDASTRRVAMFVQDEFDISPQFSAYAGVRWEGIHTSSSSTRQNVDNDSRVWSPVLHGVWRIPDSKDQIRLGLTSTYRAPALNDLIAIPSISNQNSATRPDRTGNPNLKPELSKGIDLAFEHYLSRAGIVSLNLFARSIDDLIRRRTVLVDNGSGARWVSSPVNVGHALTKGMEFDTKFQLQEFLPEGPAIDFRANYSRFWSSVDDIPGPNNRLDQQPKQTANLGMDYRVAGLPLTLGGSVNWTPAYEIQSSTTQIVDTGKKRQFDAYALWKWSPNLQLRLSANNLSPADSYSANTVTTGGIYRNDKTLATTYTTWTLRLEMKI